MVTREYIHPSVQAEIERLFSQLMPLVEDLVPLISVSWKMVALELLGSAGSLSEIRYKRHLLLFEISEICNMPSREILTLFYFIKNDLSRFGEHYLRDNYFQVIHFSNALEWHATEPYLVLRHLLARQVIRQQPKD